jgi:hypothetical protein
MNDDPGVARRHHPAAGETDRPARPSTRVDQGSAGASGVRAAPVSQSGSTVRKWPAIVKVRILLVRAAALRGESRTGVLDSPRSPAASGGDEGWALAVTSSDPQLVQPRKPSQRVRHAAVGGLRLRRAGGRKEERASRALATTRAVYFAPDVESSISRPCATRSRRSMPPARSAARRRRSRAGGGGEDRAGTAAAQADRARPGCVVRHVAVELGIDAHEIERSTGCHGGGAPNGVTSGLAPCRCASPIGAGPNSRYRRPALAGRKGGARSTGSKLATRRGRCARARRPRARCRRPPPAASSLDLLAEGSAILTPPGGEPPSSLPLGLAGRGSRSSRSAAAVSQALAGARGSCCRAHHGQAARDSTPARRKAPRVGDASLTAIASEDAARLFGLGLRRGIAGAQFTRREIAMHPGCARPATVQDVLCSYRAPPAPGRCSGELGRRGVNLTKLESRPVPGAWRYRFYSTAGSRAPRRRSAWP